MRNLQRIFKSIVQFHNGCLISTAIAVVWCTEDSDNVPIMTPVVSLGGKKVVLFDLIMIFIPLKGCEELNWISHLHDQLMSAGHQREAVSVVEGLRNVLSKRVTSSTWRDSPATAIIRV